MEIKEKEAEKKPVPGEINVVAKELGYLVTNEDGKMIACDTEQNAIELSYLIKLWMKHKNL